MYWVWPLPRIPVTTRIITFLVGNPYKPLLATGILGRGHTQDTYFVLVRIVSVFFGVPGFVGDTCLREVADGAGGCLWWWADLRVWGARTRWGVQIGIAKLPRIANLPKKTQKKFLVIASFEVSKDIWRSRKNIGTRKNNRKEGFTWRLWTALARQIWNVWSFLRSLKSCTVKKKGWLVWSLALSCCVLFY